MASSASEEEVACRICRGEGSPEEPLYFPCKCSGSIKFVHQDCLFEWLKHSKAKASCELCNTPYRLTKLYAPNMPSHVPVKVFVRKVILDTMRLTAKATKFLIAYTVYCLVLPYLCIGGVRIHTAFAESLPNHPIRFLDLKNILEYAFKRPDMRASARLTIPFDIDALVQTPWIKNLALDVFQGQELIVFFILLLFIIMMVREWILQNDLFILQLRQAAVMDNENQAGDHNPQQNNQDMVNVAAQVNRMNDNQNQINPREHFAAPPQVPVVIDAHDNQGPNEAEHVHADFLRARRRADEHDALLEEGVPPVLRAAEAPEQAEPAARADPNEQLVQFLQRLQEEEEEDEELRAAQNRVGDDEDMPQEELDGILDFIGWNRPIISLIFIGIMGSIAFFLFTIFLYFIPYTVGRLVLALIGWRVMPLLWSVGALVFYTSNMTADYLLGYVAKGLELIGLRVPDFASPESLLARGLTIRRSISQLTSDYSSSWILPDSGFWVRLGGTVTGYVCTMVIVAFYVKSNVRFGKSPSGRAWEKAIINVIMQLEAILKVICIIGIELVIFPIFCGTLLHFSILPVFESTTLMGSIKFTIDMPITSTLIHWSIGTLYMFVFALFVSLCRKIMRAGVLYFVRDPNDPNFHPIRDVLERTLVSQLGKIGISAVIYSILIVVCLGGVLFGMRYGVGLGFLPLKFKMELSYIAFRDIALLSGTFIALVPQWYSMISSLRLLRTVWAWWFDWSCSALRLSSFILNRPYSDEQGSVYYGSIMARLLMATPDYSKPVTIEEARKGEATRAYFVKDGGYVRAPDTDSLSSNNIRLKLFIPVNKYDVRQDGVEEDGENELKQYDIVYRPPNFRIRIALLLALIWGFGVVVTITTFLIPLYTGKAVACLIVGCDICQKMACWMIMLWGIPVVAPALYAVDQWPELKEKFITGWNELRAIEGVGEDQHEDEQPAEQQAQAEQAVQRPSASLGKTALFIFVTFLMHPWLLGSIFLLYGKVRTPVKAVEQDGSTWSLINSYITGLFDYNERVLDHKAFSHCWLIGMLILILLRKTMLMLFPNSYLSTQYRAMLQHGWMHYDFSIFRNNFAVPLLKVLVVARLLPLSLYYVSYAISVHHNGFQPTPADIAKLTDLCYEAVKILIFLGIGVRLWYSMFRIFLSSARDDAYLVGEQLENHTRESL